MTINNTWAYNIHDPEFKTTKFLIRALVEVASPGGNFLLNVGPQPDGVIQPDFQERLRAMTFRQNAAKLQIDIGSQAPDPNVSTIVLNTL